MNALAAIPTTAKNKLFKFPSLLNLDKLQPNNNSFTNLKVVVSIVTKAAAVKHSEQFLKATQNLINILPKTADEFGALAPNVNFKNKIVKDYQSVTDLLTWLSKFDQDEKTTKKFVANMEGVKKAMEQLIDYLTVAINSQMAINELKQTKNTFTLEELKVKFLNKAA